MPDPRIFPVPNIVNGFATVGAASTLVMAANDRRLTATFVNCGDEVVYLSEGIAAVMGSGSPLYPSGVGSIGTHNLFYGAIYGICESGDLNLAITEGYR